MVYFREVQRSRWLPWPLLIPVCYFCYAIYVQVILKRPFGDKPAPTAVLVLFIVFLALLFWWISRSHLETEVRDDGIMVHFVSGSRRKVIPFAEIAKCEVRTYEMLEYGGFGVKRGPNGRCLTVSGTRGVQLELADGQRLLIGSQKADELAAAIQARMQLINR